MILEEALQRLLSECKSTPDIRRKGFGEFLRSLASVTQKSRTKTDLIRLFHEGFPMRMLDAEDGNPQLEPLERVVSFDILKCFGEVCGRSVCGKPFKDTVRNRIPETLCQFLERLLSTGQERYSEIALGCEDTSYASALNGVRILCSSPFIKNKKQSRTSTKLSAFSRHAPAIRVILLPCLVQHQ